MEACNSVVEPVTVLGHCLPLRLKTWGVLISGYSVPGHPGSSMKKSRTCLLLEGVDRATGVLETDVL